MTIPSTKLHSTVLWVMWFCLGGYFFMSAPTGCSYRSTNFSARMHAILAIALGYAFVLCTLFVYQYWLFPNLSGHRFCSFLFCIHIWVAVCPLYILCCTSFCIWPKYILCWYKVLLFFVLPVYSTSLSTVPGVLFVLRFTKYDYYYAAEFSYC
jgi:hypothetical protein